VRKNNWFICSIKSSLLFDIKLLICERYEKFFLLLTEKYEERIKEGRQYNFVRYFKVNISLLSDRGNSLHSNCNDERAVAYL